MFELKGEKVILREMKWSDLDDYERWNDLFDKIYTFPGGYLKPETLENIINRIIEWMKQKEKGILKEPYSRLEIDTNENEHIGWVKICTDRDDEPHYKEFEIFILAHEYENVEFYKEAIELWIDYLFKEREWTRIGITTWEGNKKILKAANKLGFKEEGRIRKSCFINDKFHDRIRMGLLGEEWIK